MAEDDVRWYEEPRPVLVEHEGRWYRGLCEGWSRWPDGVWMASVTFTVGVGEKYVRSVPPERVRPDA